MVREFEATEGFLPFFSLVHRGWIVLPHLWSHRLSSICKFSCSLLCPNHYSGVDHAFQWRNQLYYLSLQVVANVLPGVVSICPVVFAFVLHLGQPGRRLSQPGFHLSLVASL